ncbi:MAG: hypothetical protein V4714_02810 [Bacteroidota bacterium]
MSSLTVSEVSAVTVNTAIDDRFGIFHGTAMSASEKEAPYLIDIHLNNPSIYIPVSIISE